MLPLATAARMSESESISGCVRKPVPQRAVALPCTASGDVATVKGKTSRTSMPHFAMARAFSRIAR